jgi:hypothetical protein
MLQTKKIIRTSKVYCPRWYGGNLFFLVLFLIIWLPIGLLLLVKNASISKANSRFYLKYYGSWFWLFVWGIIFFPIAILLFLVKGVDVIEEETVVQDETIIERL